MMRYTQGLLLLLIGASASAQQSKQELPAVMVEVAQAAVTRVAPRRWVPGSVVSRNDARLATSRSGCDGS